MDTTKRLAPGAVALRAIGATVHVVAVCALAYFASAELVSLTGVLAHRAGMARADAVMVAVMLGFGYLWLILIWAFSRRRALHAWVFLGVLIAAAVLTRMTIGVIT